MKDKEHLLLTTLLIEVGFLAPDAAAAVMAKSVTVYADLLRCGIETLAVFFAWLTIRKINRASAGRQYDYGLGKLENVASVLLAGIFLLAALWIIGDALVRFRQPARLVWGQIAAAFVLNLLAIAIDGWLWRKNAALARQERSPVMDAAARLYGIKTLSDVLIAVVLLLAVSLTHLPWIGYLDPGFSLVIACVMIYSSYGILSESVRDLLDGALEEGLQLLVLRCLAAHFHDYQDFHGMRSRRAGNKVFIEVFLEFDGRKPMAEVQAVIDRMKEEIGRYVSGAFVSIVPTTASLGPTQALPGA